MSENAVQVETIRAEVAPVVQQASQIVVADADSYAVAANFLTTIKGAQKKVEEWFADPVKRAHEAWKALTAKREETMKPLKDAEGMVKQIMVTYQTEQERIRRAEQARLQAEADEKARKERERLEKQAAKVKSEEKKAALLEQAEQVQAPVVAVASAVPEVKGQSIRKTWKARITDPKAAAMSVMQFQDWQAYIKLNEAEFNRFAARTKGAAVINGVEFYEETTLAAASK